MVVPANFSGNFTNEAADIIEGMIEQNELLAFYKEGDRSYVRIIWSFMAGFTGRSWYT